MQDNHYVNFGALVSEVSELEHFIWDSLQSRSGGIGPQKEEEGGGGGTFFSFPKCFLLFPYKPSPQVESW